MNIANRLIVATSLLLAAGCAHHDRESNNAGYSSTTYGTVGSTGSDSYNGHYNRYSSGKYSSPDTSTSSSFNSQQNSSSFNAGVSGDTSITSQVQQSLRNDTSISGFSSGIMVNAQNGTVTLTGTVPSEQDKQKVETMVKNTSGVVNVNNQLQVSLRPTSERQDQGSRIYHDSKDQSATPNGTSGNSSADANKPQASTDASKSDLSTSGTTGTSSSTPSSSLNNSTSSSQSSTASTSPSQNTSGNTDLSGTTSQNSTPSTAASTPSTPTSDRSSTRIYGGQQKDTTSSVGTSDTAASALSFNVQGATDADKSIGRQVMQELRSDASFASMLSQIKINVDSGKLTLTGNVKSEEQKQKAESIAQKVTGVSTVDNQLKVSADATGNESK